MEKGLNKLHLIMYYIVVTILISCNNSRQANENLFFSAPLETYKCYNNISKTNATERICESMKLIDQPCFHLNNPNLNKAIRVSFLHSNRNDTIYTIYKNSECTFYKRFTIPVDQIKSHFYWVENNMTITFEVLSKLLIDFNFVNHINSINSIFTPVDIIVDNERSVLIEVFENQSYNLYFVGDTLTNEQAIWISSFINENIE